MVSNQLAYKCVIALLIGCGFVVTIYGVGPQVNTTVGMIEGSNKSVTVGTVSRDINIFMAVPYAEPPIGARRFKVPKRKGRMADLYYALQFPFICPQDKEWLEQYKSRYPPAAFVVNEDCLYLNIYAPVGGSSSKATMIFIHGGAYLTGTANMYDGSALATIGDVVVVTINYRLGALGFLSTYSPNPHGNFGFFDQFVAIQWVSDNIENFGGDKEKITLFGESAGSSSVALQSITPFNKLFKRVILESGSALNPWALANDPNVISYLMSAYLDCGPDIKKLYDCLKNKSVADILSTQKNVSELLSPYFSLGPVIDKVVLTNPPRDLYNGIDPNNITDTFVPIDHLIGTNSQEGAFIYNEVMGKFRDKINDTLVGMPRKVFDLVIEQNAKRISANQSNLIRSAINYQYTDHRDEDNGFKIAKNYINSLSDNLFYNGILEWAQFHAKAANDTSGANVGNTYFYYYDHRGSWESQEPWRDGADHADELPMVFGLPFIFNEGTQDEKDLSAAVMTYWTNFAKTGDPNLPNVVAYPVTWPKYTIGDESYIRLSTDKTASTLIGKKLLADRVAFWKELIPDLLSSLPAPTTSQPCPLGPATKPTGGSVSTFFSVWVLFIASFTSILLPL